MIKVKHIRLLQLFFLLSLYGNAQNFGGNAPSVKWRQIKTQNATVIFPNGLDSQANRIASAMLLLDSATASSIGGPQKKWDVVLQNQTTIPNAYVRMAPKISELYMTPPQDNFSTGSLRWDDNLIIHENRHIQQFSNFNKGVTKVFSFFLGQEGQLLANGLFIPDYFFEGDAVWQETLVSEQGRGRMPSFYNGFKSLWATNKKYSWWKYRSGSLKDYVPDHYQLGYLLTAYGYEKFGADFWSKVTNDAVRLKSTFNRAIAKYSNVPFKQFRQDAVDYFRKLQPATYDIPLNIITTASKNNVVDYEFPHYLSDGSIVVSKKSYKQVSSFYIIKNEKEEKISVKKSTLDDYFSCNDNTIAYASYQSDPRWGNRDYSVINLVDIKTKAQRQLTFKSKYFSPCISKDGTQIVAVKTNTDGSNNIVLLNAATGGEITTIPNKQNWFFTYPVFLNSNSVISAARNHNGKMSLVKVNIENGNIEELTAPSYNVIGFPFVKSDTVYFSKTDGNADKVFALTLSNKKIHRLTNNVNSVYAPSVSSSGQMVYSVFTEKGAQLAEASINELNWQNVEQNTQAASSLYTETALKNKGEKILEKLQPQKFISSPYKKGFHLFNFHSWRAVAEDPEYGYSFFSDNILSNFRNAVTYTYNRTDKSHNVGYNTTFAGWFPYLSITAQHSFNRTVDTAVGRSAKYNAATFNGGFSIPLSFTGGRTNKFFNAGAGYNLEQYYYKGVGKNIFNNKAINYVNAFLSFSNVSRKALQNINPRWAQAFSVSYRDAFSFRNSHKFMASASLYFPGLFANHSLVINGAYQKRDTLPDLFSKSFPYARGYEALSTRRMYKWGVNYHFPLLYPDGGIPGLIYFQRIRANLFYDYNKAKGRVSGLLTEIVNRSTGTEIYFDTKVWNSLPVTFGVRYTRLLDTDILNLPIKQSLELIIPINLIPN